MAMRARWQRTLLAVGLGLAVSVCSAQAGEPAIESEGGSEFAVEATPKEKKRLLPRARSEETPTLAERWRNRTPILCYSHFNDYSCGGVHSELAFLFGSCRMFFGERCLKGPPPSPVPGFDPDDEGLTPPGHHDNIGPYNHLNWFGKKHC